ncbi:serine hydrolase domain-containing protein [Sphingomonas sp. RS2018]
MPIAISLAMMVSGAAATVADIDAAARAAMARTGAKGLAVAVVDRGRVTAVRTYGARNAAGAPLGLDTVMYGASLTKAVFGYLVAQLAAEGRIGLDVPTARYLDRPLPDYGNLDAYGHWGDLAGDERWRRLTPRMLLNHASGFANYAFVEPDGKLRFHADPGTRYGYSGEGILLLQFVLEKGLGIDVGKEVQRRILMPAGATRTSLMWRADFATDLADGWDDTGKPHPHDGRSRVRASGSMDTTIADMARITAFIARGEGLPKAARAGWARGTLAITTRSQFPTIQPDAAPVDRPAARAALGVVAFDGPQGPGWYKGGHDDITANTMVCIERSRRCVVVLSNDVRAERAFPTLVRAVLGETGVPFRWEYPGAE